MTSASWSGASVVRWLLVLAAVAALVFVLAWQRARVAPRRNHSTTLTHQAAPRIGVNASCVSKS